MKSNSFDSRTITLFIFTLKIERCGSGTELGFECRRYVITTLQQPWLHSEKSTALNKS
jgi:hypothetical protein